MDGDAKGKVKEAAVDAVGEAAVHEVAEEEDEEAAEEEDGMMAAVADDDHRAERAFEHRFHVDLACDSHENVQVQVFTEHQDDYVGLDRLDDADREELQLISHEITIEPCPRSSTSSVAAQDPHEATTVDVDDDKVTSHYEEPSLWTARNAATRSRFIALTTENVDGYLNGLPEGYSMLIVSDQGAHDHLTAQLAGLTSSDVPVATVHGFRQRDLLQRFDIGSYPALLLIHSEHPVVVEYDGRIDVSAVESFYRYHVDNRSFVSAVKGGTLEQEAYCGCRVRGTIRTRTPQLRGTVRIAILGKKNADLSHVVHHPNGVRTYYGAMPGYRYFWHSRRMTHAGYRSDDLFTDHPHISFHNLEEAEEEEEEEGGRLHQGRGGKGGT